MCTAQDVRHSQICDSRVISSFSCTKSSSTATRLGLQGGKTFVVTQKPKIQPQQQGGQAKKQFETRRNFSEINKHLEKFQRNQQEFGNMLNGC